MSEASSPRHTKSSVQSDWRSCLPENKARAYTSCTDQLETSYTMFSVSLNEALGLRRRARWSQSYQILCITPPLCARLASSILGLLLTLEEHARHYGTAPNTVPLDPQNFQGGKEQRTALMSDLLSKVLLTRRSQFLHKVGILQELVENLCCEYQTAVRNLTVGSCLQSEAHWRVISAVHYNLNTCLRETIVLYKSFLVALPEDQLAAFQAAVRTDHPKPTSRAPIPETFPRHRRMAPIAGQ